MKSCFDHFVKMAEQCESELNAQNLDITAWVKKSDEQLF